MLRLGIRPLGHVANHTARYESTTLIGSMWLRLSGRQKLLGICTVMEEEQLGIIADSHGPYSKGEHKGLDKARRRHMAAAVPSLINGRLFN